MRLCVCVHTEHRPFNGSHPHTHTQSNKKGIHVKNRSLCDFRVYAIIQFNTMFNEIEFWLAYFCSVSVGREGQYSRIRHNTIAGSIWLPLFFLLLLSLCILCIFTCTVFVCVWGRVAAVATAPTMPTKWACASHLLCHLNIDWISFVRSMVAAVVFSSLRCCHTCFWFRCAICASQLTCLLACTLPEIRDPCVWDWVLCVSFKIFT